MVSSPIKHGWLSGQMNLHWLQFKLILIPREKQWERWGWVNIQNKVQTGGFSCSLNPNLHVFFWHLMSWGSELRFGQWIPFGRCLKPMLLLFHWGYAWPTPVYCTAKALWTRWVSPVTICNETQEHTPLCLMYCLFGLLITLWFVKSGKLERGWQKNLEG